MSYILLMTSAGSILFIGCFLWEKLMGNHMSQADRYRALIIVMFTYLVPWVWLKNLYIRIGDLFQRHEAVPVSGQLILNDAAIRSADEVTLTPDYSVMLIIVGVWVAGAVSIMLLRCAHYFFSRRRLLKLSTSCEEELPQELLGKLERELHLKRRPRIVRMSGRDCSLTIGAVKPVVFLQKDCREGELELILRHEFVHIARGDMIIKLVMALVCCLHWFNPLVYFLSWELTRTSEKACDERVIQGRTEDERETYAMLIVRSVRGPKKKVLFGSFLASNEKYAEERIRVIMNKRKVKRWEKIVVAGVFAAMVFADSLTAMAYPEVYHVEEATEKLATDSMQGRGVLRGSTTEETSADTLVDTSEDASYPVVYDEEIITAAGEILDAQAQTRVFCLWHKWEDAEYLTHVRDDNGGCTLTVYSCTYCHYCNTIKIGEWKQTIISAECTHDDL